MLSFKPNARSSSNVTTEGRCPVCNSDIMIQLYSTQITDACFAILRVQLCREWADQRFRHSSREALMDVFLRKPLLGVFWHVHMFQPFPRSIDRSLSLPSIL